MTMPRSTWSIRTRVLVVAFVAALVWGNVAAGSAPAAPAPAAPVVAQPVVRTGDGGQPDVAVIGTGGTIAGVAETRVSFQTYRGGTLEAADLVAYLQPELGEVADVSPVEFGNQRSTSYTLRDYHALSLLVDEQLASADAVVVTAGTDTLEELAYWLDLTVRSPKPVVVTGALRPWNVLGSDGPANLYNAVVLAASGRTTCFGTVTMLNDEVFAAREVTKTNAQRVDALQAREVGVLGYVDEARIRLLRAPARVQRCDDPAAWATPFDLSELSPDALPRVEIVSSYQDAGGEAITAFAAAGVKGIVVAATGDGGISDAQAAAGAAAIRQGVVFVGTTRTGSGAVYAGAEGIVPGEDLAPQKARLLLVLSLAETGDVAQVRRWFDEYGVPEFAEGPEGPPGG